MSEAIWRIRAAWNVLCGRPTAFGITHRGLEVRGPREFYYRCRANTVIWPSSEGKTHA